LGDGTKGLGGTTGTAGKLCAECNTLLGGTGGTTAGAGEGEDEGEDEESPALEEGIEERSKLLLGPRFFGVTLPFVLGLLLHEQLPLPLPLPQVLQTPREAPSSSSSATTTTEFCSSLLVGLRCSSFWKLTISAKSADLRC
jgi:hypothetical protein